MGFADDSALGGSGTMDVGKSEGAPMTADNTVEFLDLYNRLERLIRERYNLSRDGGAIAWLLSRDKAPRALRDELDYCREVRNFLQHNERIDGSYAVIPSDAMLDALRSTLERFEGMGAAEDVCTRREKIRVATMDEPLRPVLRDMAEHGYAHVPILVDGRVVGVLSESTVLSYLVDDMALEIPEAATLKQLERLLALDAHELISTGKRRSSVVITAVNYIEQHYAEELTLGKIAEEIYVSPPYLSNIFKEKMDINLMSYIHKVRVEKAKKLLLESSLSIQKVAELVGYRHEKHFMQIFKKACGMTPSQFRFRKKE